MKFINNPRIRDILIKDFMNSVLSSERAVFNNLKPEYLDFSSYITIERNENEIIVSSNYNCGLCPYNIFKFDDYNFYSLYPTCQVGYENEWRKLLAKLFPTYKKDLKEYLSKQYSK